MTPESLFADDKEREGSPHRRARQRRFDPRLATLGATISVLALGAAGVLLAGQHLAWGQTALSLQAREARSILGRLQSPADISSLSSQQAGAPVAAHRWLALCVAGGHAVSSGAIALSPKWGSARCPAADAAGPTGQRAESGPAPLPTEGWHVVWNRAGPAPAMAVGLVFDATPAAAELREALNPDIRWPLTAAAACALLAALALGAAQFQALRRLHGLATRPVRRGQPAAPFNFAPPALAAREIVAIADHLEAAQVDQHEREQRSAEILGVMRRTWQQCSDAVLLVDNTGCVVYCNGAGQEMLRDPGDRVMGLQVDAVLPGLSTGRLRDRVLTRFGGPGAEEPDETVMLCRRNGELVDLDIRASLVGIDGEPVFLVMATRHATFDPAAATTAAAATAGAQPPAAAPAAAAGPGAVAGGIGAHPLIATISHELRTPLNGIIGMTDLLGRTALGADQKDLLETLRTSTRQLRALLNDILDIAKVESGQLKLEFLGVELVERAGRSVEAFQGMARAKGVRLEFRHSVPELHVSADPTRIGQILNNLLDNALKFTPAGGQVTVALAVEPARTEGADLRAVFTVTDTGVGIAPDKLPSLFEPFRQAEDSTARRYGGTGLGLSLCRRLSRAMNGDIDVSSRPGSGSTFRVWLELKRSASSLDFADTQPMENANDDAQLRGRRVLVADDNTISQKLLTRWLEQEGVIVELVANGEDAVRRARQGGLDMILMDLSMPVMDGFDATRTIRAFVPAPGASSPGRPPSAVPIIGVTARAMPGDRDACIRSGMDGYVTKPLKRNELIRTMASAVRSDAPAPPPPARAPQASA